MRRGSREEPKSTRPSSDTFVSRRNRLSGTAEDKNEADGRQNSRQQPAGRNKENEDAELPAWRRRFQEREREREKEKEKEKERELEREREKEREREREKDKQKESEMPSYRRSRLEREKEKEKEKEEKEKEEDDSSSSAVGRARRARRLREKRRGGVGSLLPRGGSRELTPYPSGLILIEIDVLDDAYRHVLGYDTSYSIFFRLNV